MARGQLNLKTKRLESRPGIVAVISSPSGAGKTTICRQLVKKYSGYRYSISATARPPRKNEKNGVDYVFMSDAEFVKAARSKAFIESARYLNHWYGTPKRPLLEAIDRGDIMLLDIDVQGAAIIRRAMPHAVTIFVLPPSLRELKRRLLGRKTEDPIVARRRLAKALSEIKSWNSYDYVIINEKIGTAVKQIHNILTAESNKTVRLCDKKYWKKSLAKLLGLTGTRR